MSSPSLFQYEVVRLTDPTPQQIEQALDVHMVAQDMRYHRILCEGDEVSRRMMYRYKIERAFLNGEIWVAVVDSKIVAVAIWAIPGAPSGTPNPTKDAFLARLSPEGREFAANRGWSAEAKKLMDASANDYYLLSLAAMPDYQRKGLARALIGAMEPKARSEERLLRLSCQDDTYVIYEKCGFKVVLEDVMNLGHGHGTCLWFFMAKDVKDTSAA